ncbi:hypothetical protein HYS48_03120 [Candidatus Woesearchaeota archaeon]|nr:hypothetical protein [Candidatus Woesearchaeota archaeon]
MGAIGAMFTGLTHDLRTLNTYKINNYLKQVGSIIKFSPSDVKMAYYAFFIGLFMVLIQIFLWVWT